MQRFTNSQVSKNKIITLISTYFIFGLFLVFGDNSQVHAQGFNFEVSPAKVNIVLEPGEETVQKFNVGNYSGSKKKLFLYTQDFVVLDENGAPTFLENQDPNNEQYSLTKWISLSDDVIELENDEVKEVEVKVNVPDNAEPGGHYAALFVQTEKPTGDAGPSSIGSVGRIASLILSTVPGEVDENISVTQFFADRGFYIQDNPEITLTALFKNNGTAHGIPTGAAFLSGGMNFKPRSVLFNTQQGAVLPGAPERKIAESFVIKKEGFVPPMGKINAELLMKYGSQNYELNSNTSFWLIPIKFLIIMAIVLAALAFVIWRTVVSYKK